MLVVGLRLLAVSTGYLRDSARRQQRRRRHLAQCDGRPALAFGCSLISVFARPGRRHLHEGRRRRLPISSVRSRPAFRKANPRNPARSSPITSAITSAIAPVWPPTSSKPTASRPSLRCCSATPLLRRDKFPSATTFPLVLGAISIVASIVGVVAVSIGRVQRSRIISGPFYRGLIVAGVLALIGFYFAAPSSFRRLDRVINANGVFFCAVVGVLITELDHLYHRILHGYASSHRCNQSPRPRSPRPRDQHHRRARGLDAGDDVARDRHRP